MKKWILKSSISNLLSIPTYVGITKVRFIAPFYHCISNRELPHIKHLYYAKTSKEFEQDLDFLLKYYQPIHPDDIQESSLQKKNSFLLSFDDGLREFHEVAAPILKRKGIPCICFLNSAFIDNKQLFYRFKASLLIEKIKEKPLTKNVQETFSKIIGKTFTNPHELLQMNYAHRGLLDALADLVDLSFNDFMQQQQPYMSTEQIKELALQGFVFGGHSMDHPLYTDLSLKQQIQQTVVSSQVAAKISKNSQLFFSFPFTDFGVKQSFFNSVKNEIHFTMGTAGMKHDIPTNIQRIPFEIERYSAKEILKSEYLYYMLKSILHKNNMKREF